jgi:hypothetical protein
MEVKSATQNMPSLLHSVTAIPGELQRAIPVFGAWRENFDDEIGCVPHAIADDSQAFGRNEEEIRLDDERQVAIQDDVCTAHFSKVVFANVATEKFGEAEQDGLVPKGGHRRLVDVAIDQLHGPIGFRESEIFIDGGLLLHDDDDVIVPRQKSRKTSCHVRGRYTQQQEYAFT